MEKIWGSPWFSRGLPTGVIPTQLPWYQWKYFSSQRSYLIMNQLPCGCLQEHQRTAGPSTTLLFCAPGDRFLCWAAIWADFCNIPNNAHSHELHKQENSTKWIERTKLSNYNLVRWQAWHRQTVDNKLAQPIINSLHEIKGNCYKRSRLISSYYSYWLQVKGLSYMRGVHVCLKIKLRCTEKTWVSISTSC